MTDALLLREQDRLEIVRLLARHLPDASAWAYGSRVNGGAHEGSDLDIVLRSPDLSPIPLEELRAFVQAVRDSNIPILVEARDWARLPESFQQEIMKNYVVLRETVSEWREHIFGDVAIINPREKLLKGSIAKKITMDILQPFTKKLNSYYIDNFNGGVKFRNGDILIARITPCFENGKTSFVDILDDEEVAFGSTEYIVIRERKNISDRHFLYYLSISPEFRDIAILSMTGSSGRQRIQTDVVKNHIFEIPPLPEQKAIASVLSSLDDKIDLLHRQNKTLEAMAEALFRQWFVEEAGEDWEEGCLIDIADINPRYALKKGTISTYVEMKSLNTMTFNPDNWIKREFTSGMKFKNNDTLLARITPCLENGKTAFITILDEDEIGWGSTEYIIIRMKKGYHPFISYIISKDKEFRDFAIGSMSGSSGRQRAEAEVLKNFDLKIPPREIVFNLNIQLSGIVEKLKNNAAQIHTLEKLRDTLLPKLMSGEVRVAC